MTTKDAVTAIQFFNAQMDGANREQAPEHEACRYCGGFAPVPEDVDIDAPWCPESDHWDVDVCRRRIDPNGSPDGWLYETRPTTNNE
jgi:hypothetical protein